MRRRRTLNLALAVAVALLGALLWLNQPRIDKPEPITRLQRSEINRVVIEFPHAPSIRLERTPSGWMLREPVQVPARAAGVAQILRLAERLSKQAMPAASLDLGKVGFQPPRARVTFNHTTVLIGGQQPLQDRRYVRVGDTVHLIAEPNMRVFNPAYAELVSWSLLPPGVEIQRLELPGTTLKPTPQGGWTVSPAQAATGPGAAEETILTWKHTEALSIESGVDARAEARVQVVTARHGTLTFEVVAREPQLLLRRPEIGVTFHVAGNRVDPLLNMRHPSGKKLKGHSDIPLVPDSG